MVIDCGARGDIMAIVAPSLLAADQMNMEKDMFVKIRMIRYFYFHVQIS